MKNSHWEKLIKGNYYDINEATFSSTSSLLSFSVVFDLKEDADKIEQWLKLQGGEYVESIQNNKIYDNEQISDSTGIQANYEVHNYDE